jgi:hypothetical protein
MGDQLAVGVDVVLSDRDAESRNVDGDVQEAKEDEGELSGDRIEQRRVVGLLEVCDGLGVGSAGAFSRETKARETDQTASSTRTTRYPRR